jgi:formylglycine-generating enzyme required for sulfatase activity
MLHSLRRPLALVAAVAALVAPSPLERARAADATGPGFARAQPAEGPFVVVEGGFMVPYEETIPGTDVKFQMIPVMGGEVLLGSPASEPGREEDEGPQVRVRVEPFWMGRCEVTWAEYHAYMEMYQAFKQFQALAAARGDAPDAADDEAWRLIDEHAWSGDADAEPAVDAVTSPTPLYDPSMTYSAGEEDNQPAVSMTQFAARQYTKWLSGVTARQYRLPSEAEWEHAARAGTTTAYSWGNDSSELDRFAWHDGNADYATHPVGTKEPNPWGLCDMHGNVAEWTLDEYAADRYAQLGEGPVDAWPSLLWPTQLYPRVIRGGSWLDQAEGLRSAARLASEEEEWKLSDPNRPLSPWWYTEEPALGVGMRVVRGLAPLSADDERRVWDADVDDLKSDLKGRLKEGRGTLGVADPALPAAVEAAENLSNKQ